MSLVRSIIDYGGSVYFPTTKKNIQLVENIQKRATKILPELKDLPYRERLEVVRLAKYNLYRYIGCIIYQSNWSGPFSLVVMTPDL